MSRFCLTVHRWGRIVSLHWKDLHRPRRQTTTCKRDGGIAVSIVHPPLGDVSWTSQLAFFPARRGGSMACSHCSSGSPCRPQRPPLPPPPPSPFPLPPPPPGAPH